MPSGFSDNLGGSGRVWQLAETLEHIGLPLLGGLKDGGLELREAQTLLAVLAEQSSNWRRTCMLVSLQRLMASGFCA